MHTRPLLPKSLPNFYSTLECRVEAAEGIFSTVAVSVGLVVECPGRYCAVSGALTAGTTPEIFLLGKLGLPNGFKPVVDGVFAEVRMLYWSLVFLVIALIAAVLGFGGVAVAAAGIAKILFFLFLVIFVVTLALGMAGRRRSPPL
jgi:uncharacterized membrane protein YtjA (UPF0391 family)